VKTWISALGCGTKVVGLVVVLWWVSALAQSNVAPPPPTPAPNAQRPSAHEMKAWRETLSRVPRPKKGCFKSSYPSLQWQEVPCTTPPPRPHAPGPEAVNDLFAQVPGLIQRAVGSFDNPVGKAGGGAFSLQLNSNTYLNPPACSGAKDPTRCWGWQQFIFDWPGGTVTSSSPVYAPAYMQYWLINYNNPCPKSSDILNPWLSYGTDCFKNSDGINPSIPFGLETLDGLVLSGNTEGGKDTVGIFIEATGEFLVASGQDSFLDLGPNWQSAEFNVFGIDNGAQLAFTDPTYINVTLAVDDGTSNAPMCLVGGTTAETNNLTILPSCCRYGGASPKVTFAETNLPDPPPPVCAQVAVQTAVQYVLRQFKRP
jgi:hypothetical protein